MQGIEDSGQSERPRLTALRAEIARAEEQARGLRRQGDAARAQAAALEREAGELAHRVAALTKTGGWASHVLVDAADLVPVPAGLDPAEVETLVVNGIPGTFDFASVDFDDVAALPGVAHTETLAVLAAGGIAR